MLKINFQQLKIENCNKMKFDICFSGILENSFIAQVCKTEKDTHHCHKMCITQVTQCWLHLFKEGMNLFPAGSVQRWLDERLVKS